MIGWCGSGGGCIRMKSLRQEEATQGNARQDISYSHSFHLESDVGYGSCF